MHVLNENLEDKIRTSRESQQSHLPHFNEFYIKNMKNQLQENLSTSRELESLFTHGLIIP